MNITDNLKLGSTSYGDPNAPKLVVTPGWATDSNFLKPFVSLFPDYNVILLDMPGYGKSEELKQFSISTRQTANLILNSIPKDCTLISWSLSTLAASCACYADTEKRSKDLSLFVEPQDFLQILIGLDLIIDTFSSA